MEALIWVMQQTRGGLELRRLGRLTRGLHGRTQRTAVRAAVAEPLHRYDACGLQPAPDAWTVTCQLTSTPCSQWHSAYPDTCTPSQAKYK